MTALVQAALTVRRGARGSFGYAAAAGLGLLLLLGLFRDRQALGIEHAVVALAWTAVLAARVAQRWQHGRSEPDAGVLDFEIGLLLLVAAHALLQLFGGVQGPLYPLMYALIGFIGAFAERRVTQGLVLTAIVFEAALYFGTESAACAGAALAARALARAVRAAQRAVHAGRDWARARCRASASSSDERERVRDDARLFRLVAAPTDSVARRRAHAALERGRGAPGAVLQPRSAQAHDASCTRACC